MQIDSPSTKNGGVALDKAPPRPADAMSPVAPDMPTGAGELANSPELLTMQGMALIKDGVQLLSSGIPELAPLLDQSLAQLEQMVAQAMTQNLGAPAPPGVAPMMGPPPAPGMAPGMSPGMAPGAGPPMGMPPQQGRI